MAEFSRLNHWIPAFPATAIRDVHGFRRVAVEAVEVDKRGSFEQLFDRVLAQRGCGALCRIAQLSKLSSATRSQSPASLDEAGRQTHRWIHCLFRLMGRLLTRMPSSRLMTRVP